MCVFNPSHSKILLTCGVGDGKIVAARRTGQPALVVALAEKASLRLHKKFRNLQQEEKALR